MASPLARFTLKGGESITIDPRSIRFLRETEGALMLAFEMAGDSEEVELSGDLSYAQHQDIWDKAIEASLKLG